MRERLLWLCTCTSLEIMTATGVTAYLLYLGQGTLALISAVVFAKVIVFHFAIEIHERLKRRKAIKKPRIVFSQNPQWSTRQS